MTEDQAKFNYEKNLPAPDVPVGRKTKKIKKPWTFDAEWKPEARFSKTIVKNGEVIQIENLTIDEYLDNNTLGCFYKKPFCCFGNFKTKEQALQSWEDCKRKPGSFIDSARANYRLINKSTGETITL